MEERALERVPNPHNLFEFDCVVYFKSNIVIRHVTHRAFMAPLLQYSPPKDY